ncbi:TRAP transporter large permease subunit [Thalassobaculum sp. OXR-137]|uniref:TRAP transporter large permease subunit n=1 Tax=Thalassobaculum sp. OXR-137 TaxID=3100173 RepID=UPI002AC92FF3|nr:TRAP transporter large permease subunit [Thalassobaculum sp. OXR-137]WPZ36228.1 TRAP transporter large permease subunit [Thalassobaculum sp. OXR-137]
MNSAINKFSQFSGLAVAQLYFLCGVITLYEVISRYAFHSPTQWAFEMVMVFCATAWMLSAGYVTLKNRHIGITVFYLMASDRTKWRLDLFALIVGVIALFLLTNDTMGRALEAISNVERAGSAFNSPEPMLLKTALFLGATVYLLQLLANFYRHLANPIARLAVVVVSVLLIGRLVLLLIGHYYEGFILSEWADSAVASIAQAIDLRQLINIRAYHIGTVSVGIVITLLLLMMTGMPLGVVTLIISIVCALLFFGPKGLYLVSTNAFGLLESYPLVAVPLFVLMASILEKAGIAEDLFDAMSIFAGNLRGGVAVQTVIVAVIMAAMSGIMGGEIVMLGLVALPQMLRLGYDRKLSIGTICAGGSLATLIPPSIIMIVYGLSAQVSIGDLFMAGALPGLLLATFYIIYVLIRCYLNPSLAPTASEVAARGHVEQKLSSNRSVAVGLSILLIACVMGSIYGGIASVTEAAGVGVFGSIVVAAVRMRFNWKMLQEALTQTMATVGTIIWLILGAVSFVGIYNLVGGGEFMRSLFSGLDLPAIGIILVMMAILVVLGTFMEWIAIVFITVPIFAPVVVDMAPELGLDPEWAAVWFGVLFVMNMQIYFLSPPFGPACFWLKSVAPPDIELQEIFAAVIPFIGLQIIGLILVMIFPEIALWLPQVLT